MPGNLLKLQDKEMEQKDGKMRNQKLNVITIFLEELKLEKLQLKRILFLKTLLRNKLFFKLEKELQQEELEELLELEKNSLLLMTITQKV
jgi:hypothetical protein